MDLASLSLPGVSKLGKCSPVEMCIWTSTYLQQVHPTDHDERELGLDLVSFRRCVLFLWQELQEVEQEQQRAQHVER